MHIGGIQGAFPQLIPASDLEFLVRVTSAAGQRKDSGRPRSKRVQEVIMNRIALLVSNSYQKVSRHLAIDFDIPYFAARVAQPTADDIGVSCGTGGLAQ